MGQAGAIAPLTFKKLQNLFLNLFLHFSPLQILFYILTTRPKILAPPLMTSDW